MNNDEILNKIKEKNKGFYEYLMMYVESKSLRALSLLLLYSKQYIKMDSVDYYRPMFEINDDGEIILAQLVLHGMHYYLKLDPETLTIHVY